MFFTPSGKATTDKNSHIHKHLLSSPHCNWHYSDILCLKILDLAKIPFVTKIKEALCMNKFKPELNRQIKHFNTIFSL